MGNLKIITESLPERCEICHQSDCFDPITNRCTRCQNVATPVNKPYQPRPPRSRRRRNSNNRPALVTTTAPTRLAQNLFIARLTLLVFTYFGFIIQFVQRFYQSCQRWIKYAIREDETLTKKRRRRSTQHFSAHTPINDSTSAPINAPANVPAKERERIPREFVAPHPHHHHHHHHRQTRANTRNHYRR